MMLRRILVTRPIEQAETLCRRLSEIGIEAIAVPMVAIHPPQSFDALDRVLRELDRYQWVIFTSVNGVRPFFERWGALAGNIVIPTSMRWAAIGPATAASLIARGVAKPWMPTQYLSEALARDLPDVAGRRILRVRPEVTTPILVEGLRARGGIVDEVVAYRTIEGPPGAQDLLAEALRRGIDGVIFTSASTVRGFARLLEATGGAHHHLPTLELIAIGPVTAAAIEATGWHADLVADEHDIDGIVQQLQRKREPNASGVD